MTEVSSHIKDISNSLAFSILEDVYHDGKLTKPLLEYFKSQYAKLHEYLLQTYENEKNLLKKAKSANSDVLNEKLKLEKLSIEQAEHAATLNNLRTTLAKTENELVLGEERHAMLVYEIAELERERAEHKSVLEERERDELEKIQPEMDRVNKAIAELKEDIEKGRALLDKNMSIRAEHVARVETLEADIERQEEVRISKQNSYHKIQSDPDRLMKQADVIEKAKETWDQEQAKLLESIEQHNQELLAQQARKKQVEEMRLDLGFKLEMQRSLIETKQRGVDELIKKNEQEKEINHDAMACRVQLEIERKMLQDELRREQDALVKRQKQLEKSKREYKKKEAIKEYVNEQLPALRLQKEDAERQLALLKEERQRQKQVLEELRQEVDIYISTYLKQEAIEKEKKEELERFLRGIKEMEADVQTLMREEYRELQKIAFLTSQREKMSREASLAIQHARETREELKVKDLVIVDLSKKFAETNHRLKEFSALYDVVKNERNKYVNLIQSSSQALSEMKEKIKILQNEVDILKNESSSKDKGLQKAHFEKQTSIALRDATRMELNKLNLAYAERQETIEQQIIEIDKLNSVINSFERDMLKLKKQYEVAVETRNYTGIQLIDRNDELCILYEKANIQESILKRGETEIRRKEEELRMLHLELQELQRQLEVLRKQVPEVPQLTTEIAKLKKELQEEKEEVDKLSAQLEHPDNNSRWRLLGGEDADVESLAAKLQVLEERLNDKKEALLEKELVLEEITSLADKLRKQAVEGREGTLQLAEKVNEFQSKIKDLTRRMMATVAELSMYQATAMKLAQEKEDKQQEYESALERFEAGLPPTDDADEEFARMERDRAREAEDAERRAMERASMAASLDPNAPQVQTIRTTAEPRPNAYIPDEMGIPKPYGGNAPFKPSELGAQLRHFKKPEKKPIII